MPDTLRLFIAVELAEEVRAALEELQRELKRRPGLERLRWTRPEGIHLTLKFLGETPAGRVPEIESAITEAAAASERHALTLGKLGTFGGRRMPRVLWVDLEGEVEALQALQERIDRAMERLGFKREQRAFSPHLTLARIRPEESRDVAGPLAEAVEAVRAPAAEIPVRELSLMRSELKPGGAVYTRLFSAALQ